MLSKQIIEYCENNFQSSAQILKKIFEYKKFLLSENLKMNLIGKNTEDDFDQRHILDCIQIHNYIGDPNLRILDLGTGAGLPGILLSILGFKNMHLVEKSPKKSNFLNNCKSLLGIEFTVHNNLIEKLKTTKFDTVVARAFAPIVKIISATKNITDSKTKYILLKGKSYFNELEFVDQSKYDWKLYPSLTSDESKIVVIQSKWLSLLQIKKEG